MSKSLSYYNPVAVENRLHAIGTDLSLYGSVPTCYVAGPMRGLPEYNFPAFEKATATLRKAGWKVHSCAERDIEMGRDPRKGGEVPLRQYMKDDLAFVCDSDAVFVLPGWEESTGAQLEVDVAQRVDVPVFSFLSGRQIEPERVEGARLIAAEPNEVPEHIEKGLTRLFDTGATRNADTNKPDYEGFLSPLTIREFGRYMHEHRHQADGTLRSSDNWQKGIPREQYMKSLWRHVLDVWTLHRGFYAEDYDNGNPVLLEDALCGVLFNAGGLLHEILRASYTDEEARKEVSDGQP